MSDEHGHDHGHEHGLEHGHEEEHSILDAPTPQAPKHIAVFMAHADDAEFLVGGSVARWAAEGNRVTYIIITNSDKGTEDPHMTGEALAALRQQEQRAACEILGVQDVIFVGRPDNSLDGRDVSLKLELTRIMRQIRPDVVICQDPSLWWRESSYINHPDHRNAGEAVITAAFPSAGNRLSFPELLAEGLEPIKIKEIWVMGPLEGDHWVDISDYLPQKLAALKAHASQMGDWDPTEEITKWAEETGKQAEPPMSCAEEFRVFNTSG
jgi:LmbE family N-acetylglucosaminyl deacetylase